MLGGESSLPGGEPVLLDPEFLDNMPEKPGNRSPEFSGSVLVADDRSMTDGSVGKVSGDPLFMPESDEAPVERPREESDVTSVSGGMREPEARFAMGCAIPTSGMRRGGNTAESAEDERAVVGTPLVGAAVGKENMRERSGPLGNKLRGLEDLCMESGRLSAEMSERAESDGDKERESACGTAEVTDSPDAAASRDSWTETEDGEERRSDGWLLGTQVCSLFRESVAVHGDVAARSRSIGVEYERVHSLPGALDNEGEITPTTGTCKTAL